MWSSYLASVCGVHKPCLRLYFLGYPKIRQDCTAMCYHASLALYILGSEMITMIFPSNYQSVWLIFGHLSSRRLRIRLALGVSFKQQEKSRLTILTNLRPTLMLMETLTV